MNVIQDPMCKHHDRPTGSDFGDCFRRYYSELWSLFTPQSVAGKFPTFLEYKISNIEAPIRLRS